MEVQLGELKRELGEKVDWEAIEGVLEGDFDEGEWERVVGDMLAKSGEDVSSSCFLHASPASQ